MVKQNSANKRSRYQFGTNRLVHSAFYDEDYLRKKQDRHDNRYSRTEWDKMTAKEKKEYVLNKYGPGKKHNNYIALSISYYESEEFNEVIQTFYKPRSTKAVKIEYKIMFDKPMRLRLNMVDRLILNYGNKWYYCTLDNRQTKVTCFREEKNSNAFIYYIKLFVIKVDMLKGKPFEKWHYKKINHGSDDKKDYTLFTKPKDKIEEERKSVSSKINGARLLIIVNSEQFKKIQESSVLTLSGKIECTITESINKLNKFYCACENSNKILEADIADSAVLTASNGYCYKVKIHNCRILNELYLRLDDKSLIVSAKDNNGYKIKLYK